ncbi:enoyl-CoA hydratase/isomerase family protein [Spongiibacter sp. KMU-166]|uniref:Enoyl-CoA hydratase/isomerase family protein n=1 Tax=Spongiibacter thalassae TaxID=2721624 RepID=A0ABX1G9M2_9GAMM|nr:enoyl-CoA hydratase/isomerase family protein [Spongiibacter thalassae]NKI15859.1 enoyl-CoA hydratase/isomerase family protein [Spongiibacter thalassae]
MSADKSERNYETIILEHRDDADWLTLNRPAALNAMNRAMIDELSDYFTALYRNHSVRVVVLKAAGRAFCAGLDLSDIDGVEGSVQQAYQLQTDIRDIMKAMRRCPQPIISQLHGAVCGGGFTMALASDIRIAADNCKMNAAFIKIGLTGCDMGASYFLPRLVGTSVASELILTGRFIDAERALRVNLVSDVVAKGELEKIAQIFVDEMLLTAPMGLRLSKDGLNIAIDAPSLDAAMALEDRQQILVGQTRDHLEAVTAFFEKRPPVYQDK